MPLPEKICLLSHVDREILLRSVRVVADILRSGGLAIIPTETVYGIAADVSCPPAIDKIYQIKGRDLNKLMSWHISLDEKGEISPFLKKVAPQGSEDLFHKLVKQFWPGPLMLILPDPQGGTLGLRCPKHAVFEAISRALGGPMVATSANFSGQKSPCSVNAINDRILRKVDVIVDAGPTMEQVDSTVLDLTGEEPKILREGAVKRECIDLLLRGKIE